MKKNYLLIMKNWMSAISLILFFAAQSLLAQTTIDLSVDPDYNLGTSAFQYANISSHALQPDGKIIIGGDFTSYNNVAKASLCRINIDGTLDTSFNLGAGVSGSKINAIKVLSDGKIIVGGLFSYYNGTSSRYNIIRLNADGSIDTTFDAGGGFNSGSSVKSIDILPVSGKLIIGGDFTSYNGISRSMIALLDANGALDTGFNPSSFTNTSSTAYVYSVKAQADGKILVGGSFDSYNNTAVSSIVRLNTDASLDSSFANPLVQGSVYDIALKGDGTMYLAGPSATYNSTTKNGVLALSSAGVVDVNFNASGTGFQFASSPGVPYNIQLQSDGKLLLSGDFTSYNGTSIKNIARIDATGSLDTSFNPGNGFGFSVSTAPTATLSLKAYMLLDSSQNIFISGNFNSYSGTLVPTLIKVNSSGTLNTSFASNTKAFYRKAGFTLLSAMQSDDKLIIAGDFNMFNVTLANYIIRMNTDGTVDTGFNVGGSGFNGKVTTLFIQPDGKILAGGDFTSYNGSTVNKVARLNADGTLDATFNPGIAATNGTSLPLILALRQQTDGKVLVGGQFNTFNGSPALHIVRLNANGSLDAQFNVSGTGINVSQYDRVNVIGQQTDGKILLGGSFTQYNGTAVNGFARLNTDGSLDTAFVPSGGGFSPSTTSISTLLLQPDGKIIAVGNFSSYNGSTRTTMARINTDGSFDSSFYAGTAASASNVQLPLLLPSGKILVPGTFTAFNGVTRNRLILLNTDGSVDTSFVTTSGSYTGVAGCIFPFPYLTTIWRLFLQTDGKLLAMGNFTTYNTLSRIQFVRLIPSPITSLNIENQPKKELVLSPNPAKDFVTISNISKGASVALFDMTSKLLYSTKSIGTTLTLNTTSFKNGLYLLKVDGQVSKLLISK